jgi:hypothetical protein
MIGRPWPGVNRLCAYLGRESEGGLQFAGTALLSLAGLFVPRCGQGAAGPLGRSFHFKGEGWMSKIEVSRQELSKVVGCCVI